MRNFRSLAFMAGVTLLGSACGGPEQTAAEEKIPTFEEFAAEAIHEEEGDIYVVNGDEALQGLEALREHYESSISGLGTSQDGLLLYYTSGDRKWSSTQKLNLTYCVSKASFGTRHSTVVNAMASAAGAWEAAAYVNFIHKSTYDSDCTSSQTGVLFDVRMTTSTSYLARAFFPGTSRSGRNILISTSAFGDISPWTLTGVLRHELGHVLGFRHEHTRYTSNSCYEDSYWRSLTSHDTYSVMHYPQCGGSQTGDLVLTSKDKSGAASVYGT